MQQPPQASVARPRLTPVHIVGTFATPFLLEHDAMLDELVFEAVYGALRDCGLRRQDLGLSVLAQMDVLDGRSISSGLTNAAAGGYLRDSFRIESDAGAAVIAAAHAVAAGDVEVAVAVGVHNPETTGSAGARRAFDEQISNLGFDPHFTRPVGMTATATYAMHAGLHLDAHPLADCAELAAAEISRGASRDRSVRRDAVTPHDVLASTPVAWPLHSLMLPAHSTGAVAVVLASPARAGRCLGRDARLTGLGHATGGYTWDDGWLRAPGATSHRAAQMALGHAGIPANAVALAEVTAPTPALHFAVVDGLGITDTAIVNASGGVRSNFPGLANGALRLLEVVEQLADTPSGTIALSHSADSETGTVSEDVTVLVVEAA